MGSSLQKIGIGGIWHETNTFSSDITTLEDFQDYQWGIGEELLDRFKGIRNEIGGFIDEAACSRFQPVPLLFAAAVPSGIVKRDTYEYLKVELLRRIGPELDGVLLALHGAMVVEGIDDVEADLTSAARERLGVNRPLVATFDLHANLSKATFRHCDVLIGYDTYPHVDPYDRALEASRIIVWMIREKQKPFGAFRKLHLLTVPQSQETAQTPMKEILERVWFLEKDPRVLSVSIAPGYPYSDLGRLGFSIVAYSRSDAGVGEGCLRELADFVWSRRRHFHYENVSPGEAVRLAQATAGLVVLVDTADNIGGGAPGDGTVILRELLAQGAQSAVVTLVDREAVQRAIQAGVRKEVHLVVGGKCDRLHGEPVDIKGKMRLISDGIYRHQGSYMPGQKADMGRAVVLDCNGVDLVLMERPTMPFDAQQLRSLGIEPERKRILVVKSAIAWKAAYGEIAKEVIYVDTPGICSSNLKSFRFTKIPRPMFPLDEI